MAFNDYIILGGKRYKTLAKQWRPTVIKPSTARVTLQGQLEASFGPANILRWQGMIIGPVVVSDTNYGTIEDLRAVLNMRQLITFQDHYGQSYDVIAQGPFDETSVQNVWNANSNKIYVLTQLMTVRP